MMQVTLENSKKLIQNLEALLAEHSLDAIVAERDIRIRQKFALTYNKTKLVFTTRFPFVVSVDRTEEEQMAKAAKYFNSFCDKNGKIDMWAAIDNLFVSRYHWSSEMDITRQQIEVKYYGAQSHNTLDFLDRLRTYYAAHQQGIPVGDVLNMSETEVKIMTKVYERMNSRCVPKSAN